MFDLVALKIAPLKLKFPNNQSVALQLWSILHLEIKNIIKFTFHKSIYDMHIYIPSKIKNPVSVIKRVESPIPNINKNGNKKAKKAAKIQIAL